MKRFHFLPLVVVLPSLVVLAGCLSGCTGSPRLGMGGSTTTAAGSLTSLSNTTWSTTTHAAALEALVLSKEDPHELLQVAQADPVAEAQPEEPVGDPLDWVYCRGPEFNGISRETGLPDDWDPDGGEGSNVKWARRDLGLRSTPIVMNGKVYVICRAEPETAREGERVVCLDTFSGATIWENRFNVWLSDVPDTRVGWSSVVGDPASGNVYALGVCGYFQCLNGETGETKWSVSLHEKFGLLSTYGGRTNFPLVVDDQVIISAIVIGWGDMAKPAHQFISFDKTNGEVVWFNGTRPLPYDTTYSAPSLGVFNGQQAMVFGSGDGSVWAIQPKTGAHIWKYNFSRRGLNVPPLIVGDRVYTGHSEENIDSTAMGAIVAIDATGKGDVTKSGELWRIKEMMVGKSSPIEIDGRLYFFDDRAKLYIIDPKTGETAGSRKQLGTQMRSSPLYVDGKIYCCTANGRWFILKPSDNGIETVSRGRLPRGEESYGSPICSHGRIFWPTTGALYCLEDKSKDRDSTPRPAAPQIASVSTDEKPALVQLVPAELLMKPGQIRSFEVRLYNSRGQFLKTSKAEFELDGPGQIGEDGTFLAPTGKAHQATIVNAKVGDLVGRARVRIVPPLPWEFDFEGLDAPPITWVGARYRHVIREMDGSNVMVKITTIPKGTRSRCWFGHPDLSDYTIQADVKGALQNNQMPDIGLIAQGYVLDLQGAAQKLQIRTWGPQLRMARTVDYDWKPNVWFTMKFKASTEDVKGEDGKVSVQAALQGKVWPKGGDEPAEWTIEARDASPNTQGSPGLFGVAKAAELYLDNIKVTPN